MNLSLPTRISVGFAVSLLALLIISVINWAALASVGLSNVLAVSIVATVVALVIGVSAAAWLTTSASRQVGQAIRDISQASAEFTAAAAKQASGSSEQATAVAKITSTMEELSRTAEQIAASGEQIGERAEAGRLAVNDSLEGMSRIKSKVETMSERITDLAENSREIGEISDIIEDVADKTHILALNAAIESAAAGEYGRRFAVVASQIRELAEDAKSATRQVKSMLKQIQLVTDTLIVAIKDATAEADIGSELASRAGEVIEQMVEMVHTISLATQQQRSASEQVVETMHEIEEVGSGIGRRLPAGR